MTNKIEFYEKLVHFEDTVDGLAIKHTQEIPQEYLDCLAVQKAESLNHPMGEMHKVCSIPTNLVEEWQRAGFDVMKEPVEEILKRLRKHEFDKFITTLRKI